MKNKILIFIVTLLLSACVANSLFKKNLPPHFESFFPPNEQENVNYKSITFKWRCVDPENDILKFDVYFGDDSLNLKMLCKGQEKSEYPLFFELQPEKTYFYRIVAKDRRKIVDSGIIQFTTDYFYPDWWNKQIGVDVYYFGVALQKKQKFAFSLAEENAQKSRYEYLKPVIKKQLDDFMFEARIIDTLAIKMAGKVIDIMAKAEFEEEKIDKQETLITQKNLYRTYLRKAIEREKWDKKLLDLIHKAPDLYQELKFSKDFRKFEQRYQN